MDEFVTIETFCEQVWNVEGVKISITKDVNAPNYVRPYNYKRLPDNATVDDLRERINNHLNSNKVIIFVK